MILDRAVEAALAAAPEPLRALGLAFRAYLVGPPGGEAAAAPPGSKKAGGAAAGAGGGGGVLGLAGKLGSAGYRVYIDPLTSQVRGDDRDVAGQELPGRRSNGTWY